MRQRPHSVLQKVNRQVNYTLGYRLQHFNPRNVPLEILRTETAELIHKYNCLGAELQISIKADYEAFKAKELERRREEKEKANLNQKRS